MSRKTLLLVCMVLIISMLGCSGKKAVKKADDSPEQDSTKIAKTSSGDILEDLIDFNESIFEDVKETFKKSGMTLVSLKRDKKGDLVIAEISNMPPYQYAPKAIVVLYENFSSVEKILVRCVDGKDYMIEEARVAELGLKHEGAQLETEIWSELGSMKDIVSDEEIKAQAAGI